MCFVKDICLRAFQHVLIELSCMIYVKLTIIMSGQSKIKSDKSDSIWKRWYGPCWKMATRSWFKWSKSDWDMEYKQGSQDLYENKISKPWTWESREGKCESGLQHFRKWIRLVWRRKRFLISWTAWPPVSRQCTWPQLYTHKTLYTHVIMYFMHTAYVCITFICFYFNMTVLYKCNRIRWPSPPQNNSLSLYLD